jgi:hypothetical protein
MPVSVEETVRAIVEAETLNKRVQQFRLVPERHGAGDLMTIYAAVAREVYVKNLAPDFAYIHGAPFYDRGSFEAAYAQAARLTNGFRGVSEADLAAAICEVPETLLVFRTMLGLTKEEFAHATSIVAAIDDSTALSASRVDRLERRALGGGRARGMNSGLETKGRADALVAAKAIAGIMARTLFGEAPSGQRIKQEKPDTENGWDTVRRYAAEGVPLGVFLHQRHYGGAFRQVLDATSGQRGDQLEDAVDRILTAAGISFLRTGSTDQGLIKERFNITVTPAPDFVVYDPQDDELRAMLECKATNNGGTARDKAGRFRSLRQECIRLGGVALFAVLGGIGWARVNDALAPVIGATEGRVFTPATLDELLDVSPFPSLRTR